MTTDLLPQRTRTYRSHHLDSTRWDHYTPRDGDVVISTSVKAGTTWTQRIMSLFVFGPGELPSTLWDISPWIDERFRGPIEHVIERLEAQAHQRFIKSHLPLDALPYYPQVRYIMVGRDTRDVFMSLCNHYGNYTDLVYQALDAAAPEEDPFPRWKDDVRAFWRDWITKAWFEWETDGWPFWSHHYHAASFWPHRDLDNVLLVHYNDLQADLDGQMRRIASFAGIEPEEAVWPRLVRAAGFESMKADAQHLLPETQLGFGDVGNFIYKGTNQRWRGVLTGEDLELYEAQAARLEPDLRRWLENGSIGSDIG